jgi:hypothetical protein
MAAFGMRGEVKRSNDLRGGDAGVAQVNHGSADRDGFGERGEL